MSEIPCLGWRRWFCVLAIAVVVVTVSVRGKACAEQTDPTAWLVPAEKTRSWMERTTSLRETLSRIDPDKSTVRNWLPRLKSRCAVLARFADLEEAKRRIYAEQTTAMAEDMAADRLPFRRYAGQNIPYVYWSKYLQDLQGTRFVVPQRYDPARQYQIFLYYKLGGGLVWKDDRGEWVAYGTPGATFADPYQPTLKQCLRTPETFHTWSALSSQTKGRMGQHTELIDMPRAFCADFSISPDRIFFSGFSDGGFDALFIGCYYPHLVAGIAPGVANWQYTNVGQVGLYNVPTLVLDGWGDAGYVSENFARIQTLGNMGYPIEGLFSQTGHSDRLWATDEIFFPMIEWAKRQRRNLWPKRVRYATRSLHWHRAYWVSLERMIEPALAAVIDIAVEGNTFTAQTRNIAAYRLTLYDKLVDPRRTIKVINNGKMLYEGPYQRDLPVDVSPAPGPVYKNPRLPGGLTVAVDRSAYTANVGTSRSLDIPGQEWTIVLPDRCTQVEQNAYAGFLPQARRANEVTLDEAGKHHLILVGAPRENSLLEQIADRLPVRFSKHGFAVGSHVYEEPGHAVRFVCPNPLNLQRYLIVAACNNVPLARQSDFFGKGQKMFVPSPWPFREGDCQVHGVDAPQEARFAPNLTGARSRYYTWTADWKVPDETPIGQAERYFDFESLQVLAADAVREATGADVGVVGRFPPRYNQWRGWLDAGPITLNDVATLRMLPEFIVTAEVTGEQLRRLVERSAATTVLTASALQDRPLTIDSIDGGRTYSVAADYGALNGGPLCYTHGETGFKQIPNHLHFTSIDGLLRKTENVVPTCSNLRQTDLQVAEAVAAYIKKRGTVRPRPFVGDLVKYLTNPHAHCFPQYDWLHVNLPFEFVPSATGRTIRRNETISIGLSIANKPGSRRPRPNSQRFARVALEQADGSSRSSFQELDMGLPVEVSIETKRYGLGGSFESPTRIFEKLAVLDSNDGKLGNITITSILLTNRGQKNLVGQVLLGLGEPVAFRCRWPAGRAEGAGAVPAAGIVETVGRYRIVSATHGVLMLHGPTAPAYEEIRRNLSYAFGLIGLERDIEIPPGDTASLRVLLFGIDSQDPKGDARLDIGAFVKAVEDQL